MKVKADLVLQKRVVWFGIFISDVVIKMGVVLFNKEDMRTFQVDHSEIKKGKSL